MVTKKICFQFEEMGKDILLHINIQEECLFKSKKGHMKLGTLKIPKHNCTALTVQHCRDFDVFYTCPSAVLSRSLI